MIKKFFIFTFLGLIVSVTNAQDHPLFSSKVVEFGCSNENNETYYILYSIKDTIFVGYDNECMIPIECTKDDFFDYISYFSEHISNEEEDSRYIIHETKTVFGEKYFLCRKNLYNIIDD